MRAYAKIITDPNAIRVPQSIIQSLEVLCDIGVGAYLHELYADLYLGAYISSSALAALTITSSGAKGFLWALGRGPDVCDYNLHLSNSCYAKTLDTVRMKWVLAFVSQVFRVDGVLPVGATSFLFMREIPMLRRFEVRCSIVTWGEKWLYLVAKFVTTGTRKVTPRMEETTPFSSPGTPYDSDADLQRKIPDKLSEEPNGAVVHCVSISQVCFKIGRITVPPALVLTLSGCSDGNYTRTNLPPGYLAAQKAVAEGQAKDLLKGGWKRVPKSERWWEGSFGEDIEKTRAERLSVMEDIRLGMQRANAY
ncbi:uncharacterized protein ARMOST_13533 [Armillaria ostoyae]|uniref:Uncharacterized protein n=1 Tax=Armillaria ostoyae TaxID=47428 RepID=A0A284RN13_ARMOS|nr:uncharacterized protein ARMOST_13533 [Armillaria ostoyae]